MRTLEQIIKGRPVPISVGPDDMVLTALGLLAQHDIGAVLVMQGGKLVGLFSERDYARKIVLKGKASKDTRVREIMSDRLSCVTFSQTVPECLALMTDKRIRHLPVLGEGDAVLGILSIGDLVKETISDQKFTIEQLVHYIHS